MSPFPQLPLIFRFLQPQETFVRDCAGLGADTLRQDAALPRRAEVCVYSTFGPRGMRRTDVKSSVLRPIE